MAKLSKRVRAFREKVDPEKAYPLEEAVSLLKEFATVKFNETVEVAVNLGVDARKSDQAVRGATTLPHGTGSEVRVAVFTQGDAAEKAKAAGADLVGMEELAEQIKGGMMDFDDTRRGDRGQECQGGADTLPHRQERHHPWRHRQDQF